MSECTTLETTIYVDNGFEFPVEGGGELRAIDTRQDLYTASLRVTASINRIPKIDVDHSDLLQITVKIPDNKGRVWEATHIMHPFWWIWKNHRSTYYTEGEGHLANGGFPYSTKWDNFEITTLAEGVEVFADDREDLHILVDPLGARQIGKEIQSSIYFGQLRIKYFSATIDFLKIDRWQNDQDRHLVTHALRIKSHVDTDLYLTKTKLKNQKPTISLESLGPITAQLDTGAFLLQEHFRHIHEEDGPDEGAWIGRSIPVPVTFLATDETAEPCPDLAHEPD